MADCVPVAGWPATGCSGFRSVVAGGLLPLRQEHSWCTMGADLKFQVADSMVRKLIGEWRMTWGLLNT